MCKLLSAWGVSMGLVAIPLNKGPDVESGLRVLARGVGRNTGTAGRRALSMTI